MLLSTRVPRTADTVTYHRLWAQIVEGIVLLSDDKPPPPNQFSTRSRFKRASHGCAAAPLAAGSQHPASLPADLQRGRLPRPSSIGRLRVTLHDRPASSFRR